MRETGYAHEGVTRYEYRESPDAPFLPCWSGWDEAPDAAAAEAGAGRAPVPAGQAAGPDEERRRAEEIERSYEAGRARGREEERKAERQAREAAVAAEGQEKVRQAAALLEGFAAERERYFRAAEQEVVRLALAVAARILRREAASDPLLLMGAVRAALGQIAGAAEVRLRVPAADLGLWTEAVALLPHPALKPAVLADEGMAWGECRLETSLGTADLGVRAQLAEVERALLGGSDGAESGQPIEAAEGAA